MFFFHTASCMSQSRAHITNYKKSHRPENAALHSLACGAGTPSGGGPLRPNMPKSASDHSLNQHTYILTKDYVCKTLASSRLSTCQPNIGHGWSWNLRRSEVFEILAMFNSWAILLGKCVCHVQIVYNISGFWSFDSLCSYRPQPRICPGTPLLPFPRPRVPTLPPNHGYATDV